MQNPGRPAVDLSHEIVDGMVTHPGIPGPVISTFVTHEASAARYAPGTTFEIGRIDLVADSLADARRPAHTAILDAGIPLVEHLTGLDRLPPDGWRFFAVPPRIRGMGTFPVRAFALLDRADPEQR